MHNDRGYMFSKLVGTHKTKHYMKLHLLYMLLCGAHTMLLWVTKIHCLQ